MAAIFVWPIAQEQFHWQAVQCTDEASLRGYLDAYPGGRYRESAQGCLADIKAQHRAEEQERQDWQAVRCTNEASVRGYLDDYPVGRYKQQAEDCLAAIAARSNPGEVFRDCGQCPEMVVIPAGSFLMGSPSDEEGRDGDEGPQHRVEIAQPFAVGKYEVTFAQWDACRSAEGCLHNPGDRGWGRCNQPVIDVSWEDAQEYVVWLSRETGKDYRLLTEAEWEYAARAGTTTPFHFGGTISTDQANYDGDYIYGLGTVGVDKDQTVEVGMFPGNAFGLHDMHGNVFEWVEDCWHASYAGAPADGSAWTEGGNCGRRLVRGGSWYNKPGSLRAAYRGRSNTSNRFDINGFRVARTLAP